MKSLVLFLLCLFLTTPVWAGASRSFDGTDDEITAGDVLNVTTGNVSVCAWWNGTEDASADAILGRIESDAANDNGYLLRQDTTDVNSFKVGDGTAGIASTATTDTDAAWFWVCGTWDGAGNTTIIYVNGIQEDTDTATVGSLTATAALQFGETNNDGGDAAGLISYGGVTLNVLTIVEVNESMWKPELFVITPSSPSLWPLWGSNSPEIDLGSADRGGTIVAGTAASASGPPVMFGDGLPL